MPERRLNKYTAPKRTMTYLLANVGVARAQQLLYLVCKIPRHLLGRDVCKCAQGEPHRVHIGVVHITGEVIST